MKNLTIRSKNQLKKRIFYSKKENKFSKITIDKLKKSIYKSKRSQKFKKINIMLKDTINELQEFPVNNIFSSCLQTNLSAYEKINSKNQKENCDQNFINYDEIDTCNCSTNNTTSFINNETFTNQSTNFMKLDKLSLELETSFKRSRMIKIKILNEANFQQSDCFATKKTTIYDTIVVPKIRNTSDPKINSQIIELKNEYEYIFDIFEDLIHQENCDCPTYGYMKHQTEVNKQMRAILVDWIIDVHKKFNFQQETLHLTINLLDRYLSKRNIKKIEFQLLGVTCLFISAKYEEIYKLEIHDFIYVTDNTYTINDLLSMEREVLNVLDFKLTVTTAYKLIEISQIIFNLNCLEYNLARYFLEIFSLDYRITNYSQSVIAFSCLYLVNRLYQLEDKFFEYSPIEINEIEVRKCSKEIMFLYENIFTSSLKASKNKFSKREFNEVATMKLIH